MTQPATTRRRLGFAGTPAFAATILSRLIERHDIAVVFSQPARPAGRGRKLAPSAVEQLARDHVIDVNTPTSLRGAAAELANYQLDALIVVAYGLLLPKSVLDTPRKGCINVHASLLPRWRGAAPIERAMLAGDSVTGVSIMRMNEGLDTGPILRRVECPIRTDDTGDSLRARLADLGAETLLDCLDHLDTLHPEPQPNDGGTYAKKLNATESLIDWTDPAQAVALKIRALNSRQPTYTHINGQRLRMLFGEVAPGLPSAVPGAVIAIDRGGLTVACGIGGVRITHVALSGGNTKPMDVASLLNGHPELISAGQRLE